MIGLDFCSNPSMQSRLRTKKFQCEWIYSRLNIPRLHVVISKMLTGAREKISHTFRYRERRFLQKSRTSPIESLL